MKIEDPHDTLSCGFMCLVIIVFIIFLCLLIPNDSPDDKLKVKVKELKERIDNLEKKHEKKK